MTDRDHGQSSFDRPSFDRDVLLALWEKVRAHLRNDLGDHVYRSWLKPLSVAETTKEEGFCLAAPTRFMRDWIATHYHDPILARLSTELPAISELEIIVSVVAPLSSSASATTTKTQAPHTTVKNPPSRTRSSSDGKKNTPTGTKTSRKMAALEASNHFVIKEEAPSLETQNQTSLDSDFGAALDSRFTFENFIVGKPNELAFAAARRVAETPNAEFNPLFLHGGVGLGKTHLMHAIAFYLKENQPDRKVVYLSAEKFMHQFVRALMDKKTVAFKERFRSVDVLMIDDIQFICGKDSTQEEFFHTFNALIDQKRQIVLSADKSPSDLEGLEERVRSRLGWGLVADIHPTTYELRLGILQAKAQHLSIAMPQKVLEFLAHRISSNVRELEGALNRLVAHATLVGRPVTLESAQELLHDLLRANDRRVSIEEIQKRVAEFYRIKVSEMQSDRRARQVARPRQIAMYLSKQLTSRSLPEIGRKFGGRDHSTVLHGCRKVEELMRTDANFAEDIDLLRRTLEG